MDQSAVGFDHQEKLQKHESQKGEKICFLNLFKLWVKTLNTEAYKKWTEISKGTKILAVMKFFSTTNYKPVYCVSIDSIISLEN